ncbi:hypothetical protein HMPREF9123_0143 [Neisseria bacilliformis ATCC BAA-1200]|uniref:Uncharacterized protein n=1 Tax=Neisseria bacilliformis ATCC BAA-1200 TaxID=888742 RepID=F2B8W8_9NEIS|nr:hypothetical protein HMPREF9123_0143 [Neisseria bacilliformis ATCC BAA-1200]
MPSGAGGGKAKGRPRLRWDDVSEKTCLAVCFQTAFRWAAENACVALGRHTLP